MAAGALEFGAVDTDGYDLDGINAPDDGAPAQRSGSRLSALRRAIAEQARLNTRIVRVSLPEECVFDLDLRIPTDQSEVAQVAKAATDRHKGKGVAVQAQMEVTLAAMMLARFTVAIHTGGEPIVDATDERASAFADEALRDDLGARSAEDAVRRLFSNDQLLKRYADAFYAEYNGGEPDVETVEDPTAPV